MEVIIYLLCVRLSAKVLWILVSGEMMIDSWVLSGWIREISLGKFQHLFVQIIITSAEVTQNYEGNLPQMPETLRFRNYSNLPRFRQQISKLKTKALFPSSKFHLFRCIHFFQEWVPPWCSCPPLSLHRMAVFFEKMPPLALRVWDDFVFFENIRVTTTGQNFSFEIRLKNLAWGNIIIDIYTLYMQDNSAFLDLLDMFGNGIFGYV